MERFAILLCLIMTKFNSGEGHLTCLNKGVSSFNAWLCGLNDWMESMREWKQRIERDCSDLDNLSRWEELFTCSDPITVTCCNETMQYCYTNEFNCTLCYCTDGEYANRQKYQQLWRKHQVDFQTALRLYDEKLRYCGQRSECDVTDTWTVDTPSESDNATDLDELTTTRHIDDVTMKRMTPMAETTTGQITTAAKTQIADVTTKRMTFTAETTGEQTKTKATTHVDYVTTKRMTSMAETTTEQTTTTATTHIDDVTMKRMVSTTEPTAEQTTINAVETTPVMQETTLPEQGGASTTTQSTRNISCPATYQNKRFVIVDEGWKTGIDDDVSRCMNSGGNLANIYSPTHLNDLLYCIGIYGAGVHTDLNFRIGLVIDDRTDTLYLRDGVTVATDAVDWTLSELITGFNIPVYMFVNVTDLTHNVFGFLFPILAPVICELE